MKENEKNKTILIRHGTLDDLEEITALEALCFPEAEAAKKETFRERLSVYPNHFWLLTIDGEIISAINGFCTDEDVLRDEMYEHADMHKEAGVWQMIFGVTTKPDYRCRSYAEQLMRYVIKEAHHQKKLGLVLTCKDKLIHYYEKFGFRSSGVSKSIHGGVVWYDMKLVFDEK